MPGHSTRAVHAGERPDPSGAVNTPIVQSTTYRYPETADGAKASHIYSRYDNPTVQALEAKAAALEGAEGALAYASGMAAIQGICQAFLRPGDGVAVQQGVYGGTTAYLQDELAPMGIDVASFSIDEAPAFTDGTRLVWMESITNPLLRVADTATWADAAHAAGALLAVDATFASPVLHRPLEHGADLVMHSATKYLGGHSDVTGGIVAADAHRERLWSARRNLGATLDPHAAYLVMRGMKTLALRVRQQGDSALAVARHLAADDRVTAVHHPGLEDHPDHATAERLLDGPCAMVTFDLGGLDAAIAFRRRVRTIVPAASLGGVESLVSLPLETSHAYASPADRHAAGITDGLVRLSIGIEDLDDLLADIDGALG